VNPIINKKDLEATINQIRNFAFKYLAKYSPSKQQLRIYLFKKMLKKNKSQYDKKEALNLIDEVIATFAKDNLINDKYYSDIKTKDFFRRGYSINKIRYSLMKKGVDLKYIKSSISKIKKDEIDPDFFSAIKICKKRRIGPCREESNRHLFYKKDISILARWGFNYEISRKVLDISKEDFKKLCKLL
tara:strand:+ start:830 stop:1390 length:561 start_codon:yes stop_codon:yes gene_type:complete